MSNTNFTAVNGKDLSQIFLPKMSGTNPTTTTNYNSFGVDLSNIFQPWDGISPKAESTGFQTGGSDLNNIFQNINLTGYLLYNPFSASTTETGYIYNIISSSITYQVTQQINTAYIVLVGGGGGGGSGSGYQGGGAGGTVQTYGPITLGTGTYTITIGSGGKGGKSGSGSGSNNGTSGGTTSVSGPGINYSASGGGGGLSGSNGTGGSNGTSYGSGGSVSGPIVGNIATGGVIYTNVQSGSGVYTGDGQNGYLYTFQDNTNTTYNFGGGGGAGGSGGSSGQISNTYLGGGGFVGTRNATTFTNISGGCGGNGNCCIVNGNPGYYFSFNQIYINTGSGGGAGGNNSSNNYTSGGTGNDGLVLMYSLPSYQIYNNANGTETEQTVYNKVLFNWTAPSSGYFVKFQITATGAINNNYLINITVNKTDVDGNVTTLINGQFYTFSTYQTQNILIPGSPYLNAGDQIYIDYSTLATDRYFSCLVRSDSIPVISIYLVIQ
jgi:hypothetical protein